jgi:hypothetical protein
MQRSSLILLLIILLGPRPGMAGSEVEFHQHVMPLIAANCVMCHADDGVSFSFEEPDEVYPFRAAIALAVEQDRMPPWLAESGHQDYVGDYSLSQEEKSLIAEWAAAGFPRADTATAVVAKSELSSFDADLTVAVLPGGSYLPDQERTDEYRCFIIEWPYDTEKYVTGFMAEPGNFRVAHHLVNHTVVPEAADILRTLSEEEEGPGHQCFGGPLPDSIGEEGARQRIEDRFPGGWDKLINGSYWLSHWAPGMYGEEFPEDTGILMRPGSIIVVQMHYYTAFAPGESDSGTKMHFQIADTVKKPSINHPLTNNRWLFGSRNESMQIPAGKSATYEVGESFEDLANYAAFTLQIDTEEISAMELRSANIHMHAFGASGVASLINGDGRKETLLSIPRWDLAWQRDFMFTEGKIIPRSEFADTRLIVECTFSNPTDGIVYGGFGSNDEMCFNFSYMSVIRGE